MKQEPEQVLWIRAMSRMRARAGSIAKEMGIPISEARRIYKLEMGKSSPSGQNPGSVDWYLKTPMRRFQSALLLQLYGITSAKLDPRIAFADAFYHFSRMQGAEWREVVGDPAMRESEDDYSFPYQRGQHLVNIYNDDRDHQGRPLCELVVRCCTSCRSAFLARRTETDSSCPVCSAAK